ncbi:RluA family pseudouridine synthase [Amphibiibacter pelophylacis]|uniref:RluA family pseudouridine synthase n=1 Tax=Amphibiibacter pelophylacis TaxID=1799477 RepID=A0ACC6P519_9BURK
MRWLVVDEDSAGQRLDNYLLRQLKGVPKTWVYRVIRAGEVRVDKGRRSADSRVAVGETVRVPPVRQGTEPARPAAPPRQFSIVHDDGGLLVLDKPAGVAVHGGSGVSFGVIEQLRSARDAVAGHGMLELVHRLDRDTSGLLMVARKRSVLTALQDQLRERSTRKSYLALVLGHWPRQRRGVDTPLVKFHTPGGERRVRPGTAAELESGLAQRALSLVEVLGHSQPLGPGAPVFSLLHVSIKTGRTHQIRVHLASQGHPIVGDDKYGDFPLNKRLAAPPLRFDRMFLHAWRLGLIHPLSGESLSLQAPLPPECLGLLAALGLPLPAHESQDGREGDIPDDDSGESPP